MSNTTLVKTYAELTEDQLFELHRLVHGIVDEWAFQIVLEEESIRVQSGHLETVFRTQTGNIVGLCGEEITMLRNLWAIVARCLEWGLDYNVRDHS